MYVQIDESRRQPAAEVAAQAWKDRADVRPTLRTWTVGAAIVRPPAAAPPRVSIRWMTKQGHTVVAPPSAQRLDSPSSHAPE